MIAGGEEMVEDGFDPMLNIVNPDFQTRMRLYLKPRDSGICKMLLALIIDTMLAISYICAQCAYVIEGHYVDE